MSNKAALALLGLSIGAHGAALPQVGSLVKSTPLLGGALGSTVDQVESTVKGAVPEPAAGVIDTATNTVAPVLDQVAAAAPASGALNGVTDGLPVPVPDVGGLVSPVFGPVTAVLNMAVGLIGVATSMLGGGALGGAGLPDLSAVTKAVPVELPVKQKRQLGLGSVASLLGGKSSPLNTVTTTAGGLKGGLPGGAGGSPLNPVKDTVGKATGGAGGSPLDIVKDTVGKATGGAGGSPLDAIINSLDGLTGGAGGSPVNAVTDAVGSVTGGAGSSPLDAVTKPVSGLTGGAGGSPIDTVADTLGSLTGGSGESPLNIVTDTTDTLTGGAGGSPLDAVTKPVSGLTGGAGGSPVNAVTDAVGSVTGGAGSSPLDTVIDTVGSLTGGSGESPLNLVTDPLGAVTSGTGGSPLDLATGALGGACPCSPVTDTLNGAGVPNPVELPKTLSDSPAASPGSLGGLADILKGLPVAGSVVESVPIIGGESNPLNAVDDLTGAGIADILKDLPVADNIVESVPIIGGESSPLNAVKDITGGASNQAPGDILSPVAETVKSTADTLKAVPVAGGVVDGLAEGIPLVGGQNGAGNTPLDAISKVADGPKGGDPLSVVTGTLSPVTGGLAGGLDAVSILTSILRSGLPLPVILGLLRLPLSLLRDLLASGGLPLAGSLFGVGLPLPVILELLKLPLSLLQNLLASGGLSLAGSLLGGGLSLDALQGILGGGIGPGSPFDLLFKLTRAGVPTEVLLGLVGGGLGGGSPLDFVSKLGAAGVSTDVLAGILAGGIGAGSTFGTLKGLLGGFPLPVPV